MNTKLLKHVAPKHSGETFDAQSSRPVLLHLKDTCFGLVEMSCVTGHNTPRQIPNRQAGSFMRILSL